MFPKEKGGLSSSLRNNHVLKRARFKLTQGATMFSREIFFPPKDMIISLGKKWLKLFPKTT
jgi:hypothetical protein